MPTAIFGGLPSVIANSSRGRKNGVIAVINDTDFIAVAIWAAIAILVAAFLTVYLPLSPDVVLLS